MIKRISHCSSAASSPHSSDNKTTKFVYEERSVADQSIEMRGLKFPTLTFPPANMQT